MGPIWGILGVCKGEYGTFWGYIRGLWGVLGVCRGCMYIHSRCTQRVLGVYRGYMGCPGTV